MVMTTENTAALVGAKIGDKLQRVKVTRPFFDKGEVRGTGSVIDFPLGLAIELRYAGKVELVPADTKLHQTDHVPPPVDGRL